MCKADARTTVQFCQLNLDTMLNFWFGDLFTLHPARLRPINHWDTPKEREALQGDYPGSHSSRRQFMNIFVVEQPSAP